VRVTRLLEEVRDRFAGTFAEHGRVLDVEDAGDLTVPADPVRIEQALGNLVANALRHGAGATRLRAVRTPGRVELHVHDEGSGVPPEVLDRAFERFVSGGTAARAGLGLSIVAAIARAHGGAAGIANAPAGGVDAWLSLSSSAHRDLLSVPAENDTETTEAP
jgi:two-component system OmpR family sensor kinase